MKEFFQGANLAWLIGIISGIVAGLWAFYRFVYEKKLERFNNAATNIFSNNEDEVLAAVANLGVFKRDYFFEKNTTDVLLTRLYKELNYNITNAITNALIQFSNRRELLEIANAILGINRNFFFQSKPYKDMLADIKTEYQNVKELKAGEKKEGVFAIEEENDILDKRYARYSEEFLKLNEKVAYELTWHKQITADTYARIIRRASALRIPRSVVFLNYLKQIILNWDFHFYGPLLSIELYQNPFAYVHLVQFKTKYCSIKRCGFEYGLLADIEFNNINEIYDSFFDGSSIIDCHFNKGVIRRSFIVNSRLRNVKFTKISFYDIYFVGCIFDNCSFEACEGLSEHHFYGTVIDNKTILPESINREKISQLKFMDVYESVQDTQLATADKQFVIEKQAIQIKSLADIEDVYKTEIDRADKEKIITASGVNFKFNEILDPVIKMQMSEIQKMDLLKLIVQNKNAGDFVVEVYDANLTDQELTLLPFIKPLDIAGYSTAIEQSKLVASEKDHLYQRLKLLFYPEAQKTPELKLNEETNKIDEGQLLQ
jgi:hypothetical protein